MPAAAPKKGKAKPTARQAFDSNMEDAETLVAVAEMLQNQRRQRMRAERREKVGAAIDIPKRRWKELECLENEQVFIAFKPDARALSQQLNEAALRPLLRQAVVAACAAVETFVADRVMEHFSRAIRSEPIHPACWGSP